MGLLVTLATVVGYLHPRIRLVEDELTDFIVDEPLGEAEATATAG